MLRRSQLALTVLELLVVLAIAAVLAGLLVAALKQGRETAHRADCVSNLRHIALATLTYVADHDGFLPSQPADGLPVRAVGGAGDNYYDLLGPYIRDARLWLCRSTHSRGTGHVGYMSYHLNGLLITRDGMRISDIGQPAQTLLASDAGQKNRWDQAFLRPDQEGNYLYDLPIDTHHGGGNVALADGHLAWFHDTQRNERAFQLAP